MAHRADLSLNYRTGYCEQFAASMAVLGRAIGIPSRVVWGFTPGKVDTQDNGTEVITVRDNNAHAWVEMWMDGFGWVKFDPTPRGDGIPESVTAGFDPVVYLPPPDPNAPDIPLPGFLDESQIPGTGEPGRWPARQGRILPGHRFVVVVDPAGCRPSAVGDPLDQGSPQTSADPPDQRRW